MEILKAATTPDFLAMVPAIVGGSVEGSIVFVPFRGTRTFPTACRIDLPPRNRRSDVRAVVHGALGALSRIRDSDRVDVVIFTDRSFAEERGLPHLELGRAAVDGLTRAGFRVGLAACVAADGWGDYLDRSHQASGRPLAEIDESTMAVRLRESVAGEDEEGLWDRDVPDAEPAEKLAVSRMLGLEPYDPDEELVQFEREMRTVDIFEMVLEGYDESVLVAFGLALFDDPSSRDAALLHYAFGRDIGERAVAEAERLAAAQRDTGQSMDDLVENEVTAGTAGHVLESGDLLLGRTDRIPDRPRLVRAIRMLRRLVACAPDELRPGPLTMLGWCLWAMGSAAAAGAMLDRVNRLAPDYRMAALLRTWIDAGAMPEWLFGRLERPDRTAPVDG